MLFIFKLPVIIRVFQSLNLSTHITIEIILYQTNALVCKAFWFECNISSQLTKFHHRVERLWTQPIIDYFKSASLFSIENTKYMYSLNFKLWFAGNLKSSSSQEEERYLDERTLAVYVWLNVIYFYITSCEVSIYL